MRREPRLAGTTTLAALLAVSACASDSNTADTTPSTKLSATIATTPVTSYVVVGPLSPESIRAVQACLSALVDDREAPGVKFVDKVRKLSVGYTLVEPLAAAQASCAEASRQLEAASPEPASSAATLLSAANDLNAALDLASEQIRTDAFYRGGTVPAQFIPDGAAALQHSIAVFYSRASFTLQM